jgi:hypothetical protein
MEPTVNISHDIDSLQWDAESYLVLLVVTVCANDVNSQSWGCRRVLYVAAGVASWSSFSCLLLPNDRADMLPAAVEYRNI